MTAHKVSPQEDRHKTNMSSDILGVSVKYWEEELRKRSLARGEQRDEVIRLASETVRRRWRRLWVQVVFRRIEQRRIPKNLQTL